MLWPAERRKHFILIINILWEIFSNRVPHYSNYITSIITELNTQTDHQTKTNTQISTARTITET